MTLMRLVAAAILTMNNLTRVVIQLALISEEHSVTHFVVHTITRRADYASSTSLKMLAWPLSFDRETRAHLLGIQARKGPNTQDSRTCSMEHIVAMFGVPLESLLRVDQFALVTGGRPRHTLLSCLVPRVRGYA